MRAARSDPIGVAIVGVADPDQVAARDDEEAPQRERTLEPEGLGRKPEEGWEGNRRIPARGGRSDRPHPDRPASARRAACSDAAAPTSRPRCRDAVLVASVSARKRSTTNPSKMPGRTPDWACRIGMPSPLTQSAPRLMFHNISYANAGWCLRRAGGSHRAVSESALEHGWPPCRRSSGDTRPDRPPQDPAASRDPIPGAWPGALGRARLAGRAWPGALGRGRFRRPPRAAVLRTRGSGAPPAAALSCAPHGGAGGLEPCPIALLTAHDTAPR